MAGIAMVGIVDCLVATGPMWSHLLECVVVVVYRVVVGIG